MNTLRQVVEWLGSMPDDIMDALRSAPIRMTVDWIPGKDPEMRILPQSVEESIGELITSLQEENTRLRNQLAEQVAYRALEKQPYPVQRASDLLQAIETE